MRTKTAVGALHPLLFFVTVYVVALFLSIFICSSIFKSLNGDEISLAAKASENTIVKKDLPLQVTSAVVLR